MSHQTGRFSVPNAAARRRPTRRSCGAAEKRFGTPSAASHHRARVTTRGSGRCRSRKMPAPRIIHPKGGRACPEPTMVRTEQHGISQILTSPEPITDAGRTDSGMSFAKIEQRMALSALKHALRRCRRHPPARSQRTTARMTRVTSSRTPSPRVRTSTSCTLNFRNSLVAASTSD